jgi:hypothetical protein
MLPRRSRAHEVRIVFQQSRERRGVAADDGVDGGFEARDRGVRLRERLQMRRELLPVLEVVVARDDRLRVPPA